MRITAVIIFKDRKEKKEGRDHWISAQSRTYHPYNNNKIILISIQEIEIQQRCSRKTLERETKKRRKKNSLKKCCLQWTLVVGERQNCCSVIIRPLPCLVISSRYCF
uniref:Uncharacterized protein n=1 Tax=Cacopsylla melanoneura TaxID=428564 RepID=A0A8D8ZL36_9HEMI